MSNTRTPSDEVEYRVKAVAEKVARGYTRKEAIFWIANESGWGIGESQAYIYYQRAWDLIRELGAVTKQQSLGKALFDLDYLYKTACEKGEFDLALKVRKELSDTLGIKKQTIKFETPDGDGEEEMSIADALMQQITLRRISQAQEIESQQARDRRAKREEKKESQE